MAAVLAGILLFSTACGDDDDGGDAATTTTEAAAEGAGGDFCSGYVELLAGEPTPEGISSLAEIAPDGGAEPLQAMAEGIESQGEAFFESDEFNEAFAAIGGIANDECADEEVDVTGVEYAFEGFPTEVAAGTLGVNFTNGGAEAHELVVFRKADGVTESFDEILEMDDDESQQFAEQVGGTFALPGQSAAGLFEVTEPGSYVAVCFIPIGTTPEKLAESHETPEEESAPGHFTEGMKVEFTVS